MSSLAPSKAQCFVLNVPAETPVDVIIDSFQAVVGSDGLLYLQHHGGARFMAAVSSMAAAERLVAQGSLLLGDVEVPLEPVGARIVHVSVYRLPPYVSEEGLVQVMAQYGKVKGISHVTFRDRPDVRTGTRVVKLEMSKPVPNFIQIQGHRVMVDYRGMRRVCSRCGQEGHFARACRTPRCDRCGVFGHATAGCAAPCLRCGHDHATTDCVQRRSYADAAQRPRDAGPRGIQPVGVPDARLSPEPADVDSDPPVSPRVPPAPPVQTVPTVSASEDVLDASGSDVQSNAAGSGEADGGFSSDSERLAIVEEGDPPSAPAPSAPPTPDEGDVTPGQGDPVSTPVPSAPPTPGESSTDSASTEDADMPVDRAESKRGLSAASSGSDASHASTVKKKRLGLEDSDSDPLVF